MNWKKYAGIAIFALLLVAAGAVWYRYYYNFSEGYRSGTVLKVSHKGKLFKTWEGQLQLDQMGNKIWDFSVYDDSAILEQLKNASIDGHRVTLYYNEKLHQLPWRGETPYMVYKVEKVGL